MNAMINAYVTIAKERAAAYKAFDAIHARFHTIEEENTASKAVDEQDDRFWSFVEAYMQGIPTSTIRQAEVNAGIPEQYRAFN